MTSDTPYSSEDDVVDVLPEDLDPQAFAGAYKFPDNPAEGFPLQCTSCLVSVRSLGRLQIGHQ